jgi:hypothetical protein
MRQAPLLDAEGDVVVGDVGEVVDMDGDEIDVVDDGVAPVPPAPLSR